MRPTISVASSAARRTGQRVDHDATFGGRVAVLLLSLLHHLPRNPLILVTAVASALAVSSADKSAEAQSFEIRPIALSNQAAPDTEAGTVFFAFDNPVLSGTGDVAFRAVVQLPGVSQTEGLWQGNANGLGLVARQGDQAPDTDPGVSFQRTTLATQ